MKTERKNFAKKIRPSIKATRGRRGGCLTVSHEEMITKIKVKA